MTTHFWMPIGDIVGKKIAPAQTDMRCPNGMKLKFYGNSKNQSMPQGTWFVEGVGSNISLIPESDLEIPAGYLQDSRHRI